MILYVISFLSTEVYPIMLRKASKTVPEGNGPVPQEEELEFGQLTMGDAFRLLIEKLDRMQERMDSRFDRMLERMDSCNNRVEEEFEEESESKISGAREGIVWRRPHLGI